MIGNSALPLSISCSTVRRTWLMGIAKPTPMLPLSPPRLPPTVAMAELTPITSPSMSTSGPPELPGLIAASVWIALMYAESLPPCSPPAVTGRFLRAHDAAGDGAGQAER